MRQWLFFECAFSANSPGTEIVEATATEIGCPQLASKNGHGDGVLNWFMRLKEALYVNGYSISVTCSHTESNSSYLASPQFLGTCIQILKLPQKPDFKFLIRLEAQPLLYHLSELTAQDISTLALDRH